MEKIRFTDRIKSLAKRIIDVFREYPVTMICIMLAALVGTILIPIHDRDLEQNFERVIFFFLLTAMQAIAYEEIVPQKKPIRITGYIVSVLLSILNVYVLSYDRETFLGIDNNIVCEIFAKTLLVYGVIMIGLSIHHMFRRTEEDFEIYATKAFLEFLKATVVYGLFALGLALVIWVFNELIYQTDYLLEMVELFLAGGIYVPMCLKAISSKHDEPGKFSRFCILYVLQPLQLAAFAIIYMYIIKIFVTREDPANKIFLILACLFAIGMPIWTLVHGLKQEKGILPKISIFLPYAFIPFLALQIWSIAIRIRAYGMTIDRYTCVVLVICEILYLALYAIQHIGKKMVISWCLYMAMIVAFFGFLCPGTSYDSVVINSQMKRLTKAMSADPIPKSAESTIKSSYSVISRVGYRGKKALEKNLTKEQQEKIAEFDEYGYLRNTNVYLHANIAFTNVDVSAYKKIYVANYQSSKPDNGIVALQVSYAVGQKKQTVKIDMSEYLNWVTANFDTSYDQDYTLVDHNIFPISSALDLYVTNISISYNSETQEINGLTLDGYVLEK